jgi:hypothetical protein
MHIAQLSREFEKIPAAPHGEAWPLSDPALRR